MIFILSQKSTTKKSFVISKIKKRWTCCIIIKSRTTSMSLKKIWTKNNKKSERLVRTNKEESLFVVHVALDIFHILLCTLISKLNMMAKFQKEQYEDKMVRPKKEGDLKMYFLIKILEKNSHFRRTLTIKEYLPSGIIKSCKKVTLENPLRI